MKVKENADDLTMSSSPGSGRVQKGTANVAETGTAACKSRAVLSARDETLVSGMGYRRCHGEAERMNVREVEVDAESLCMEGRPALAGMSPEPGWLETSNWVYPHLDALRPCPETVRSLRGQG